MIYRQLLTCPAVVLAALFCPIYAERLCVLVTFMSGLLIIFQAGCGGIVSPLGDGESFGGNLSLLILAPMPIIVFSSLHYIAL